MVDLLLQLIGTLFIILLASQLFTNALEYLGHRIGFSEGLTGSVFAAVATALPETSVPLIALFAGTSNVRVNEDVSVGAILGAPLMISTLSTFIMALFAIKGRGWGGRIKPERIGFLRDLHFFILAFLLSGMALYLPLHPFHTRALISFLLIALYGLYLGLTFRASKKLVASGYGVIPEDPLFLSKWGFKNGTGAITFQLLLGFALLFAGAKGFIQGVEKVSIILHISPLLLSLLIIPIATELPEKVNSILWIRKKKDTLAFGNLTGAMVFQGTLLPALGVLLTPWQPQQEVATGILITLAAAIWLRCHATKQGLHVAALWGNGFFYALYLYLTLRS